MANLKNEIGVLSKLSAGTGVTFSFANLEREVKQDREKLLNKGKLLHEAYQRAYKAADELTDFLSKNRKNDEIPRADYLDILVKAKDEISSLITKAQRV